MILAETLTLSNGVFAGCFIVIVALWGKLTERMKQMDTKLQYCEERNEDKEREQKIVIAKMSELEGKIHGYEIARQDLKSLPKQMSDLHQDVLKALNKNEIS